MSDESKGGRRRPPLLGSILTGTTSRKASAGHSPFPRPDLPTKQPLEQVPDGDVPPRQPSARRKEARSGDSADSALARLRACWHRSTVPPWSTVPPSSSPSTQTREAAREDDTGRGRDESLFLSVHGPSDMPVDRSASPPGIGSSAAANAVRMNVPNPEDGDAEKVADPPSGDSPAASNPVSGIDPSAQRLPVAMARHTVPCSPRAEELRSIAESVQWLENMADSSVSSGHKSPGSAPGDARDETDGTPEGANAPSILTAERTLVTAAKDRLRSVLKTLTQSQAMVNETTKRLRELKIAEVGARLAADTAQAHRHAVEQDTAQAIAAARRRQDAAETAERRRRQIEQEAEAAMTAAHGRIEDAEQHAKAAVELVTTRQQQMIKLAGEIERLTGQIEEARAEEAEARTAAEQMVALKVKTERETRADIRAAQECRRVALAEAIEKTSAQRRKEVEALHIASETAVARRHEAAAAAAAAQRARAAAETQRQEAEEIIAAAKKAAAQAEARWVEAQQAATEVSATMKRRLLEAEETVIAARTQTRHAQEKYWQILEEAQSALTTIEDRVLQAEKLQSSLKAAAAEAELRRMEAERALQEIVAARLREEQEMVSLRHERENLRAEILRMTEEAIQRRRQILTEAIASSHGIIEVAARQAGGAIEQQSLDATITQALARLEATVPRELPGPAETTQEEDGNILLLEERPPPLDGGGLG